LVAVPNLYYTRNLNEIQTFKKHPQKNYFQENVLFKKFRDINVSQNLRYDNKKFEDYNKKKYIPVNPFATLSYDYKDNKETIQTKNKHLRKLHEKVHMTKIEPYSNESLKKEFATKIVKLLGNINDGDPKVTIVNPILKEDKSNEFLTPIPTNIDYDTIKSTATINFYSNPLLSSANSFERTIEDKFKSLQGKPRFDNKRTRLDKSHLTKENMLPKIKQSPSLFRESIFKQSNFTSDHKNTVCTLGDSEKNLKRNQSRNAEMSTKDKSSASEKEFSIDISKYKSMSYNVFSERYNSDYVEKHLESKLYFK